jgi:3-dehydroquinate dehydratase-2
VRIAVLNGPNLNLLGVREPERYGRTSLSDVERRLGEVAAELGVELECSQHNGVGQLFDAVHATRGRVDGAVVNAGAYSHSSLALRDALVGASVPFVEVHVTNVYAREPERRHSMLAPAAIGGIVGLGVQGYELALRGLVSALNGRAA